MATAHHHQPHHEGDRDLPRPASASQVAQPADAAADLIRQKLERIFAEEPDAQQEAAQAQATSQAARSIHQNFIQGLVGSGKSLAEIQTEWHHYYSNLPDDQKHAVWQEFYSRQPSSFPVPATANRTTTQHQPATDNQMSAQAPTPAPISIYPEPTQPLHHRDPLHPARQAETAASAPTMPSAQANSPEPAQLAYQPDERPANEIKQQLLRQINKRSQLKPKHHLQSLVFGLGCGGLVLLLVLFSFFNEMFVAPFIQPSRKVNATPIILGVDAVAPSDKAEVIIPKINVQIPLSYDAKTINEHEIQKALETGVVHYPTTPKPGETGNTAFFGHSSNNIFNPGKYKFAFVLLRELIPGDTFYLTRDGIAYAYQVIDKKIIAPNEVDILNPIPGKTATATLITCDPPGTTIKRLAIIGEQVNPSPTTNSVVQSTPVTSTSQDSQDTTLPGNAPSLWHRLTAWVRGDG